MKSYYLNFLIKTKANGKISRERVSVSMLDPKALKLWTLRYLDQNHALASVCIGIEITEESANEKI